MIVKTDESFAALVKCDEMIHNANTHNAGRHENTWLNILPHIYLTRPSFMYYYVFIPFSSPMVKFSFKSILVKLIFIFWIFGSRTVYFELKFKSKIYNACQD